VSSLGALPNVSARSLSRMIGIATQRVVSLWTKRLVMTALKEDLKICVKASPETLAGNPRKRKIEEIKAKICMNLIKRKKRIEILQN
jgi:hypothetical protein